MYVNLLDVSIGITIAVSNKLPSPLGLCVFSPRYPILIAGKSEHSTPLHTHKISQKIGLIMPTSLFEVSCAIVCVIL